MLPEKTALSLAVWTSPKNSVSEPGCEITLTAGVLTYTMCNSRKSRQRNKQRTNSSHLLDVRGFSSWVAGAEFPRTSGTIEIAEVTAPKNPKLWRPLRSIPDSSSGSESSDSAPDALLSAVADAAPLTSAWRAQVHTVESEAGAGDAVAVERRDGGAPVLS